MVIDKILRMCNNVSMIHNRIAVLRAEAGLSRQELADKVGVNYQTIGFIERGDYQPSLDLAFKLARAFCVDLPVVFSDEPFPLLFPQQKES